MRRVRDGWLYFISGGYRVGHEHPDYLRVILLNGIGLISGVLWLLFLVRNAWLLPETGNWTRVAIDALGFVTAVCMVAATHARYSIDATARLVNGLIIVSIVGLLYARPDPIFILMLVAMYPPMAFLLLDRVVGGCLSVALMTAMVSLVIGAGVGAWDTAVSDRIDAILTVIAVMLTLASMMSVYIWSRRQVHRRLDSVRRELAQQSIRDPMTSLYNRRLFDESLRQRLADATRRTEGLAVLMIDLDRFKAYNDAYGHPEGDKIVRAVAGTLQACFGRADDMIFRLGGEEFCVMFFVKNGAEATRLTEALLGRIEGLQLPSPGGPGSCLTASAGVVFVDDGARHDAQSVYTLADQQLYQAKVAGRACYRFARVSIPGDRADSMDGCNATA